MYFFNHMMRGLSFYIRA
uniref:Uncharacterized protein n=1 Tax=Anguilla anguilla TaxID=7936 RepID=A0A0E9RTA2_ANGAN